MNLRAIAMIPFHLTPLTLRNSNQGKFGQEEIFRRSTQRQYRLRYTESVVKWGNHPTTQNSQRERRELKWGECHVPPYLGRINVHVPVTWLGANGGGLNLFQNVLKNSERTMWQW